MSDNIFGSLIDSVKEVFSNPQVLAQGVKDGNIARTGNTEYFIDGKDSYSELTKHNFDRGDIRQGMRANGINPYDYSGSDRKQLKTYLNNPTTDNYTQSVSKIIGDGKIQQNMLNNAVQNQTS